VRLVRRLTGPDGGTRNGTGNSLRWRRRAAFAARVPRSFGAQERALNQQTGRSRGAYGAGNERSDVGSELDSSPRRRATRAGECLKTFLIEGARATEIGWVFGTISATGCPQLHRPCHSLVLVERRDGPVSAEMLSEMSLPDPSQA